MRSKKFLSREGAQMQPMVYTLKSEDPTGCFREQKRKVDAQKEGQYRVQFNPRPYYAAVVVEVTDADNNHIDATAVTDLGDETECDRVLPGEVDLHPEVVQRHRILKADGREYETRRVPRKPVLGVRDPIEGVRYILRREGFTIVAGQALP